MSWYGDGLNFSCISGCTKCCERPGSVYVSEEEMVRIANHLKISIDEFKSKYTRQMDNSITLATTDKGCVFVETGKGCSIYPVRPKQCSTYPFWSQIVADRSRWIQHKEDFCPGIETGNKVDAFVIERAIKESDDIFGVSNNERKIGSQRTIANSQIAHI